MSNDTKILFPTEFGPLGAKAEANALNLARLYDAELVLLHAIHIPAGFSKLFTNVDEDDLRKRALAELDRYRKRIDPSGAYRISTMVGVGEPEETIVNIAKEINAAMIIFGTKGGSGLKDTLLGSAVNHVIRHAPCPVITIRNESDYVGFKNILVPLDLAQEAGEKVTWGVKFARKFGSKLIFFSALQGELDEVKRLEGRLKKSVEFAQGQGITNVEAHEIVTDKPIADAVLDFAGKVNADLICVMTQQESESGLKTSLLGSVADRLVNVSHLPVVSIRPMQQYASTTWKSAHFV